MCAQIRFSVSARMTVPTDRVMTLQHAIRIAVSRATTVGTAMLAYATAWIAGGDQFLNLFILS